ncbi:MAG: hypothetical protein ACI841_000225 [Planctomycetota bacterium]|jgi:hypothetical protein
MRWKSRPQVLGQGPVPFIREHVGSSCSARINLSASAPIVIRTDTRLPSAAQ